MDTRTGHIYDSREEAEAANVPDEHLVTGSRKALERLRDTLGQAGSFKNYEHGSGAHGPERRFCGNPACIDCADAQSRA